MDSPFRIFICSDNPETFSISLFPPLNFPPQEIWKVTLQEISFPSCVYNLQEETIALQNQRKTYKLFLPEGYYHDIKSFHHAILRLWKELPKGIFYYPKLTRDKKKIRFKINNDQTFYFSPNLAKILNIPQEITRTQNTGDPHFHSLYDTNYINVFSNIIEENIVGNNLTSLLTVISCRETKPGGLTTFSPSHPEYLSVKPGVYNNIRIELNRTDNKPLKFSANHILLKLKFVKI